MPTLAQLKAKWFLPMTGEVLGVPATRHTSSGTGPQLSVSTDGNTVEPLIDGENYMRRWHSALAAMAAMSDKEVYHASWRLNAVHTLGGSTGTTALEDLRDVSAGSAKVFSLLSMHVFADDNDPSMSWLRSNGVPAVCLDNRFPSAGSNHQKMAVFKTASGDIGMLGSIDVNRQRWDRNAHAHTDPNRPEAPTHDIGVQITGPAVADLDSCFRERWNDSTRTLGMRPLLPPQPLISSRLAAGPATGTHSVQVLRTYGLTNRSFGYSWHGRGEFTVWAAYLNAIRNATRYIYIEDQYFLAWGYPPRFARSSGPGRDVDIVFQLGEAMKRGVNLAVVVPRVSEDPGIGPMQQFQRNLAVNYLRGLRTGAAPATGDIVVAYLTNGTSDIYVHSKLMLVDDEFTLLGSANIGARSMTHDGEIHVGVVDSDEAFTRELRKTLWAEHSGLPPATFVNPGAGPSEGYTAFRAAIGTGRLRPYVANPAHVWPLPGRAAPPPDPPPGHPRVFPKGVDPYAGPGHLA